MFFLRILFLTALNFFSSYGALPGGKVLLCYYAEWSYWRKGGGMFKPTDIDPHLCTHIVYSYLGMNETTFKIASRTYYTDFELDGGLLPQTVKLKARNPELKVMISIGGWSEGSKKFSEMAASDTHRKTFVNSILEFLRTNKLDGVDMAWEYPTDRGGKPEDKLNYPILLEELRKEFDCENFVLTAQLNGLKRIMEAGYDIPRVAKALHYISLVAYQYHTPATEIVGLNAPLVSHDDENVEFSVNYLLSHGATADRVLIGLATYGHPFLTDYEVRDNRYVGAPASTTFEGPWSAESGYMGYNEICYVLKAETGWREVWHWESSTPIAVNGKKLISYDNKRSFLDKLAFSAGKKFGGAMVWSIDTDDFRGTCSQGTKFPLIKAIKEFLVSPQQPKLNITIVTEDFR